MIPAEPIRIGDTDCGGRAAGTAGDLADPNGGPEAWSLDASVYCTGRSTREGRSEMDRPEPGQVAALRGRASRPMAAAQAREPAPFGATAVSITADDAGW